MSKETHKEFNKKQPLNTENEMISEKALTSHINALPTELSPERDLWQGIELAIQDKPQERGNDNKHRVIAPSAWAASVVAAVLVTWLSFSPMQETNEQKIGDTSMLVSLMSDNFNQQKKALLVSYGQSDTTQLSADMQQQLEQLSTARATLEKALAADSDNADLINLLNFTQQQELNLLQRLYTTTWQTI